MRRFLLILWAILSFSYIIWKVYFFPERDSFAAIVDNLSLQSFCLILVAILLMPVNLLFETLRWQWLVVDIQKLSLSDAFKSILFGMVSAVVTPNGVGEFAGRLAVFVSQFRLLASVRWLLGSFILSLIIALFALPALCSQQVWLMLDIKRSVGFFAVILVLLLLLTAVFALKKEWLMKIRKSFSTMDSRQTGGVLLLTLLRYLVFSTQLLLVLLALGAECSVSDLVMHVFMYYFLVTVVPTFFLADAVIKGSLGLLIFSPIMGNPLLILCAVWFIWLINVALPTGIGAILLGVSDCSCFRR